MKIPKRAESNHSFSESDAAGSQEWLEPMGSPGPVTWPEADPRGNCPLLDLCDPGHLAQHSWVCLPPANKSFLPTFLLELSNKIFHR